MSATIKFQIQASRTGKLSGAAIVFDARVYRNAAGALCDGSDETRRQLVATPGRSYRFAQLIARGLMTKDEAKKLIDAAAGISAPVVPDPPEPKKGAKGKAIDAPPATKSVDAPSAPDAGDDQPAATDPAGSND